MKQKQHLRTETVNLCTIEGPMFNKKPFFLRDTIAVREEPYITGVITYTSSVRIMHVMQFPIIKNFLVKPL